MRVPSSALINDVGITTTVFSLLKEDIIIPMEDTEDRLLLTLPSPEILREGKYANTIDILSLSTVLDIGLSLAKDNPTDIMSLVYDSYIGDKKELRNLDLDSIEFVCNFYGDRISEILPEENMLSNVHVKKRFGDIIYLEII